MLYIHVMLTCNATLVLVARTAQDVALLFFLTSCCIFSLLLQPRCTTEKMIGAAAKAVTEKMIGPAAKAVTEKMIGAAANAALQRMIGAAAKIVTEKILVAAAQAVMQRMIGAAAKAVVMMMGTIGTAAKA